MKFSGGAARRFIVACLVVAALSASALLLRHYPSSESSASEAANDEADMDAVLERAATNALGTRDGAVVVMDAQTGRLRAVVNPRVAFGESFSPGSVIKPFSTLAALRTGALDDAHSHITCRQPLRRDDYEIRCVHPRRQSPLDPAEALAYSCNYYFSKIGEQLNEHQFNSTLISFGLGRRTGVQSDAREASGRLSNGSWRAANALGDTPDMLVTPIQLANAYAALVNGGRVLIPRQSAPHDFTPHERTRLDIAPAHRALLIEGMRGAVAYGTAARAQLAAVSPRIYGKTGTSTTAADFRATHGWFVGFTTHHDASKLAPPESVSLVVLVFLKRGNGVESAEASRPIFEEYERLETHRVQVIAARDSNRVATQSDAHDAPDDIPKRPLSNVAVRVSLARGNTVLTLGLDDYVFGVLAAEASVEDEPEALKALAVAARTYALKNHGRHARDGYDMCSVTHCQRYLPVVDEEPRQEFYELLRRVVAETSGETLRDPQGRIAETYFSASCGGATADLGALWGARHAPRHLRGARDEFCAGEPRRWTDTIPVASLLQAVRGDPRSDVGTHLDNIRVVKRDASGRAAMIVLEGERRRTLRGWDFKIIVGRALGWNVLKSSRFEVRRAGTQFVFHGTGFGHGLGLCQTGAHVMAQRGASYRRILARYFPGTTLGGVPTSNDAASYNESSVATNAHIETAARTIEPDGHDDINPFDRTGALGAEPMRVVYQKSSFKLRESDNHPVDVSMAFRRASVAVRGVASGMRRLTIASEHFRVSYPARASRSDVETALRTLEAARADVSRRLSAATLKHDDAGKVELYVHETTGDFTAATGHGAWVAAVARGRRIETQPLETLRRRGVLAGTLRHEYAHTVVESLGHRRALRWLAEGLAAHVAGEGVWLARVGQKSVMPLAELERRLHEQPGTANEMRALYAAAYREVSALIQREGEASVWRRVAQS